MVTGSWPQNEWELKSSGSVEVQEAEIEGWFMMLLWSVYRDVADPTMQRIGFGLSDGREVQRRHNQIIRGNRTTGLRRSSRSHGGDVEKNHLWLCLFNNLFKWMLICSNFSPVLEGVVILDSAVVLAVQAGQHPNT
ncbi:hypothetical protein VNO80_26344 [Phaseolus coccineus]|uniref:Uncharacterized protein n=1 Tax=Phaseolus coccineus TaxID=3886 RepID=A0AAN9LI05_PHACN